MIINSQSLKAKKPTILMVGFKILRIKTNYLPAGFEVPPGFVVPCTCFTGVEAPGT